MEQKFNFVINLLIKVWRSLDVISNTQVVLDYVLVRWILTFRVLMLEMLGAWRDVYDFLRL